MTDRLKQALAVLEQLTGDDDDLDSFGMDAMTKKRLKVGKLMQRKKGKLQKPMQSKLPYSMAKIPKLSGESRSVANCVLLLREAKRLFVTPGKGGRGKHDRVGLVLEKFFKAAPELGRSFVEKKSRPNGWTLKGSWPSSGRQVFDWEMEAWGESGGDVVVKTNLWGTKGGELGETYRVTLANVDKAVPRWLRKFFYPAKAEMKRRAA